MTLLKLLLFALSSLGSFELLRLILKNKVDTYWLPSLTVAIQVTVLFFAGLLNLLPEAVWGLYLLGFGGLIYDVIYIYIYIGHMRDHLAMTEGASLRTT